MRRYFGLTDYQRPPLIGMILAIALGVAAALAAGALGAPRGVRLVIAIIVVGGMLIAVNHQREPRP